MGIQIMGRTGIIAEVDGNKSLYTVIKPLDVGERGSYSLAVQTGTMTAGLAAAAPIFSFRWGDSSRFALIQRVTVNLLSMGTAFAAGAALLDMIVARSFSVSDSGGTAISVMNNKRRTSFGASLVTDMRIASTATLTAGTRTLDSYALNAISFGVPASAYNTILPKTNLWAPDISGEWPLVLTMNEGFIIRATVPATGVWQGNVSVDWIEVTSF